MVALCLVCPPPSPPLWVLPLSAQVVANALADAGLNPTTLSSIPAVIALIDQATMDRAATVPADKVWQTSMIDGFDTACCAWGVGYCRCFYECVCKGMVC